MGNLLKRSAQFAWALLLVGLGTLAYRAYGVAGLALALGGVVMWLLLQWTRLMQTLRRTSRRPVGTVASAVMLHARLHEGLTLLQVTSLAQSLGKPSSLTDPAEARDEVFGWADEGHNTVQCRFTKGKLTRWELLRP